MNPLFRSAPLLLAALLAAGPAHATVPDVFGMGPEHVGMASAATALAADSAAAYYNPAGIAQARHVVLDAGIILGQAHLQGFSDIVYDTDGDGLLQDIDGYPDHGWVGADYRIDDGDERAPFYVSGIQTGAVFPIWKHVAVGISAYMPSESLIRVEMEDPYIPYYVMFRNRNNRFTANPAISFQPVHGVHLGMGLQLMTRMVAQFQLSSMVDVEAFPEEGSEDGTEVVGSVQANVDEMVMSIQPLHAFNFGFLLDMGAFVDPADPRFEALREFAVAAAWRGEWRMSTDVEATVDTNGHISFDGEDILISSLLEEPIEVALYDLTGFYNPPQLSLAMRQGFGSLRLTADLTWAKWSEFTEMTSPYTEITIDSLAGTSVTVQSGEDYPDPGFEDTWSFRTGAEYRLGPWQAFRPFDGVSVLLRGGYGYTPTPVPDQTGLTNYMDSNRRIYALGLGVESRNVRGLSKGPVRLDVGFQYQELEERTVQKDTSLLTDEDGDGITDYPRGWPLGGSVTSAGEVWVLAAGLEMQFFDAKSLPRLPGFLRPARKRPAPTSPSPAPSQPE